MDTLSTREKNNTIILTTGLFDLLKDQIRRKKLSPFNESQLVEQLKYAKQVLRNEIPANVVDVNTKVQLLDLDTQTEFTKLFVGPHKARNKNGTTSIISPLGMALIGFTEGEEITWEMDGQRKNYQILKVRSC
ncbi:MAG: transcription elongation factor GreAB [Pedobacter sp.]|nr:MAG: transcription elongation factor GreAB [Pedobacter sp.]